jgi:hypothetical protein
MMTILPHQQSRAQVPRTYKIVELFTSQSCSSCPAADKVLQNLSQDGTTITLGYHITYWDHLAWKDKLSLPAATLLQKSFNAERNVSRIYTPQMVVNGLEEFVGSDGNKAAAALRAAAAVQDIVLQEREAVLYVTLPSSEVVKPEGQYRLMLLKVGESHHQFIERGENRARTVFYTSPIIALEDIPHELLTSNTLRIPLKPDNATKEIIVLLRENRAGRIIAAGRHKTSS